MSFQYSAAIDEFMFKISAWVNSESIEYRKRFRSIQSASCVGDEMGATLTHQLLGDMKAAHEVMEDFLWSGDESRYRVVRGGVEVSDSQRIQELELTLCKRVQSAYIETLNKLGQTHESRDALINLLNLLSNDFKQCLELVGGVPDTPERTIVMSPTEVLSHNELEIFPAPSIAESTRTTEEGLFAKAIIEYALFHWGDTSLATIRSKIPFELNGYGEITKFGFDGLNSKSANISKSTYNKYRKQYEKNKTH